MGPVVCIAWPGGHCRTFHLQPMALATKCRCVCLQARARIPSESWGQPRCEVVGDSGGGRPGDRCASARQNSGSGGAALASMVRRLAFGVPGWGLGSPCIISSRPLGGCIAQPNLVLPVPFTSVVRWPCSCRCDTLGLCVRQCRGSGHRSRRWAVAPGNLLSEFVWPQGRPNISNSELGFGVTRLPPVD